MPSLRSQPTTLVSVSRVVEHELGELAVREAKVDAHAGRRHAPEALRRARAAPRPDAPGRCRRRARQDDRSSPRDDGRPPPGGRGHDRVGARDALEVACSARAARGTRLRASAASGGGLAGERAAAEQPSLRQQPVAQDALVGPRAHQPHGALREDQRVPGGRRPPMGSPRAYVRALKAPARRATSPARPPRTAAGLRARPRETASGPPAWRRPPAGMRAASHLPVAFGQDHSLARTRPRSSQSSGRRRMRPRRRGAPQARAASGGPRRARWSVTRAPSGTSA